MSNRLALVVDTVMWTGGLWCVAAAVLDDGRLALHFVLAFWVLTAAMEWMTDRWGR